MKELRACKEHVFGETDNFPCVLFRSACTNIARSQCQIYRKIVQASNFPVIQTRKCNQSGSQKE